MVKRTAVDEFYVAIDIGAGLGAKIGLFTNPHTQFGETLLRADQFGEGADTLVQRMLDTTEQLVRSQGARMDHARAIGIASPGLFKSDGEYLLAANLPQLNGQFKARFPAVVPTLFVGNSEAVQERVAERTLDLGFIESGSTLATLQSEVC